MGVGAERQAPIRRACEAGWWPVTAVQSEPAHPPRRRPWRPRCRTPGAASERLRGQEERRWAGGASRQRRRRQRLLLLLQRHSPCANHDANLTICVPDVAGVAQDVYAGLHSRACSRQTLVGLPGAADVTWELRCTMAMPCRAGRPLLVAGFPCLGCACGARHPVCCSSCIRGHLPAPRRHRTDRRAARGCVLRSAALDRA